MIPDLDDRCEECGYSEGDHHEDCENWSCNCCDGIYGEHEIDCLECDDPYHYDEDEDEDE